MKRRRLLRHVEVPRLADARRQAIAVGFRVRRRGSELVFRHPLLERSLAVKGNRKDAPLQLLHSIRRVRRKLSVLRLLLGL